MTEADKTLDALSETTRKERKFLLASSGLGIVVAKTGFIPTKIDALGIEFSPADRSVLLRCIAALVSYFVVSFVIYATDEYILFKHSGYSRFVDAIKDFTDEDHKKAAAVEHIKRSKMYRFLMFSHRRMRWIRLFLDVVFPVGLGIYTALILWRS